MNIPLSTLVYSSLFRPSISHCIFMCIVGTENMLLSLSLELCEPCNRRSLVYWYFRVASTSRQNYILSSYKNVLRESLVRFWFSFKFVLSTNGNNPCRMISTAVTKYTLKVLRACAVLVMISGYI